MVDHCFRSIIGGLFLLYCDSPIVRCVSPQRNHMVKGGYGMNEFRSKNNAKPNACLLLGVHVSSERAGLDMQERGEL